jgi:hypothetical protein
MAADCALHVIGRMVGMAGIMVLVVCKHAVLTVFKRQDVVHRNYDYSRSSIYIFVCVFVLERRPQITVHFFFILLNDTQMDRDNYFIIARCFNIVMKLHLHFL